MLTLRTRAHACEGFFLKIPLCKGILGRICTKSDGSTTVLPILSENFIRF